MDETSKYNGFGYDIEDVLHGVGLTYDRFKQHLLNLNRININKFFWNISINFHSFF